LEGFVTSGFELAPNLTAGWIVHNPNQGGQLFDIPDGVRVTGGPDLGLDSSSTALWSFLEWEGDFVLEFASRYIDGVGPLIMYFGASGNRETRASVAALDPPTVLNTDYYEALIRAGRLSLYTTSEQDANWNLSNPILSIVDATSTSKTITPDRTVTFGRARDTIYRWKVLRTGRRLVFTQTTPDGATITSTWTSIALPQYANAGSIGFVIPPGATIELVQLTIREPTAIEMGVDGPISPWRFANDPSLNWNIQKVDDASLVVSHANGLRVTADTDADGSVLLWAEEPLPTDWQFSWRMTWNGIPASNNGPSGQISLLCGYTPSDRVNPGRWTEAEQGDLTPTFLASRGRGALLQVAVQDPLVPDRSDRAELSLLFGDGTIEGLPAIGGNDLGFMPGNPYDITLQKQGNSLTIWRSSVGSTVRVVQFSATVVGQLAVGWFGIHVSPGFEIVIDDFDASAQSSRTRGGRLRVGGTPGSSDPARIALPDIGSLDLLAEMQAGTQYILPPFLDLGGATIPIAGSGDRRRPLILRGGSSINDPYLLSALQNGILDITAQILIISGVTFDHVQLLLRQGARTVQIEANWFRGLTGGSTWAAIVVPDGEDASDIRIAYNLVAPIDLEAPNTGGFLDIQAGTDRGEGAQQILVEHNDINGFGIDSGQPLETQVPIPIRLGRDGYDANRNADVKIRSNRWASLGLPDYSPCIDSRVGGVEVTTNTFEIDDTNGAWIVAPQGKIGSGSGLPFDAGMGAYITGNLFACLTDTPAPHGIVVGGGYAKVIDNWSVMVDGDFPPTVDSAEGHGTITLLNGVVDWRDAFLEPGRNAGKASVGGNRLDVLDGFGDGTIPPDGCVVASSDINRPDHNGSVVVGLSALDVVLDLDAGPLTATDNLTLIADADSDRVPPRLLGSDVGPLALQGDLGEPDATPLAASSLPAAPAIILFPTPLQKEDELPATTRQIYVLSDSQYQTALRSLRAGDEIVLAEGVEVGFGVLDANVPPDNPAIIRAETIGACRANGIDMTGSGLILHGLDFNGRSVRVRGDRNGIVRCAFHDWNDPREPHLDIRARWTAVGLCDFYASSGTVLRLNGRYGAQQARVFSCLFHDCDIVRDDGRGALIEITPGVDYGASLYHLLENCLLHEINQHGGRHDSTIVIDGSDSLLRFIQMSRAGSIQIVAGRRNTIAGAWLVPGTDVPGNIDIRGNESRCYGTVVEANGAIRIMAGDTTQDGYERMAGSLPAAENSWISDCRSAVIIGLEDPSSPTRFASNSTLLGMRRGWQYDQTRYAEDTKLFPNDPAPSAFHETTVNLSPIMVGMRGVWPDSRYHPPPPPTTDILVVNDDVDVLVVDENAAQLVVS
jgi:hypothetical protein